jgi:hypothetical protein
VFQNDPEKCSAVASTVGVLAKLRKLDDVSRRSRQGSQLKLSTKEDTTMQESAMRRQAEWESSQEHLSAGEAAWEYVRQYARERPEVVILWSFGLGFILGWRLKPW